MGDHRLSNIAIVVGSRARLVVDTGMGPKNGAIVARVAAKLAPNNFKIVLTTTHYHTEHVTGESGFPPGTVLVRDAVQQQEVQHDGLVLTDLFAVCRRRTKSCLRVLSCARRMFSLTRKSPWIWAVHPGFVERYVNATVASSFAQLAGSPMNGTPSSKRPGLLPFQMNGCWRVHARASHSRCSYRGLEPIYQIGNGADTGIMREATSFPGGHYDLIRPISCGT